MIKYHLHTSMELGIMKKLLDKLYFDMGLITNYITTKTNILG